MSNIDKLEQILEIKANWVRNQILDMIASANKGHIGGSFSCTDILVTLYYGGIIKFNPYDPSWKERDRFILSKGHSAPVLYAILADLGFFHISELKSFCQKGSMLGSHPDRNIPGIEANTGSLGHGLNISAGIALNGKIDKKDYMVITLLGDCECHEGSVWEAAMFAGHHKLNNLIVIIDYNRQCVTDFIDDCVSLEPLTDKWRCFKWDVRTVDGHSFKELLNVLGDIRTRESIKPLVIIADTIKGKGVSFMEKNLSWHHGIPTKEHLEIAKKELLATRTIY